MGTLQGQGCARRRRDARRGPGRERPLRAKSSAVLLYLAEHPNRLVTHAELQRAVWPGTAVSPSVLRVSISEIRAALGTEADRFLTTVPRRGFRFVLEAGVATPIFVGRDAEPAGLHEALARARSGRCQVVLVAGEAGAGKTALLDHFLETLRVDGKERRERGARLVDENACAACHGQDQAGQMVFPRLAGQGCDHLLLALAQELGIPS